MTDEQIIKALECCSKDDCDNCPNTFGNCYANLAGNALDLINRQQKEIEAKQAHILCLKAEIERLTGILNSYALQYGTVKSQSKKIKEIKSEAITEYHEEVKKRCVEGGIYPALVERVMSDVRKEMAGD